MKHLCTILATVLAAASCASAKTFDWPIDAPTAGARQFTAYHGETVRFNLRLGGAMTNLTPAAIYYQTNGMGKAEWFGPVPGTVFYPTNDCGAAAYRFFILCNDPDGKDYTANGSLRLLDSPGFEPSAVQLPAQSLDFARIEVLNPPWGEGPGNYAAVSNAAMNALSRAEAEAGFSEWRVYDPAGEPAEQFLISYADGIWTLRISDWFTAEVEGYPDAERLVFLDDGIERTATRARLPTMADIPTDNAQLANGAGYVTKTVTNGLVTASVTNGLASAVATLAQRTSALETQYSAITNLLDGLEAALRTINGGN